MDPWQNNNKTITCNISRTISPRMTRKSWIKGSDQKENTDKDDNFEQDETMAFPG